MKIAKICYLEKEEEIELPRWTRFLTQNMRKKYILSKKPFRIYEKDDVLYGVLSFEGGQGLPQPWREKVENMMKALAAEGAGIAITPYEGEVPNNILPLAHGRVLTSLFAFEGAAEALRRQGRNPEEARFVIAGNERKVLDLVLAGMGDYVNHLSFFVDDTEEVEDIQEQLFVEKGLRSEAFSSPKNLLFAEADVVIVCGMDQVGYEHILKRYAVYVDASGNRPSLRRLAQRRWDVVATEGFYFKMEKQQFDQREAEAIAFTRYMEFRRFWLEHLTKEAATEIFSMLKEQSFAVSGFFAFGNRVKIAKNQG